MNINTMAFVLAACLGAALPAASHAASFDCRKAATWTEKAICADAALSKADQEVAELYRELLKRRPEYAQERRAWQREWLRTVRDRCRDVPCLRKAYDELDTEMRISLEPDDEEMEAMSKPPPAVAAPARR